MSTAARPTRLPTSEMRTARWWHETRLRLRRARRAGLRAGAVPGRSGCRPSDGCLAHARCSGHAVNRAVPGPQGSLRLIGRLSRDQLGTYEQLVAEYGDVVRLTLGIPGLRRVVYLVSHPDGVEQVLAGDPDGYSKNTPFYDEIAAYLGNGLLTSGGRHWRQQRRTVAPLFSHRRIAGYVDVMAEEARRLADRWDAAAASEAPIDVGAGMVDYALRTVGRVLFGADVDAAVPVIRATFPVLNEHVRRRGITPLRLPRSWPVPAQRRAAAAQRTLYEVVDAVIDRRTRATAPGQDLISLLLAARDPETGARLSLQEIRDQVLIFLLAGHETTSTALTFTIDLLGRHHDAQAAVQREIADVLADRSPHAGDIGALAVTSMAVKEAMRLYPPAYALGRVAETEVTIGGHRIPSGSLLLLCPWVTHRRDGSLAGSPAVRSRPFRAQRGGRPATVRLLPFRGRASWLHRRTLRNDGGGRRGDNAARPLHGHLGAGRHPVIHRHHPATRRSRALPSAPAASHHGAALGHARGARSARPDALLSTTVGHHASGSRARTATCGRRRGAAGSPAAPSAANAGAARCHLRGGDPNIPGAPRDGPPRNMSRPEDRKTVSTAGRLLGRDVQSGRLADPLNLSGLGCLGESRRPS